MGFATKPKLNPDTKVAASFVSSVPTAEEPKEPEKLAEQNIESKSKPNQKIKKQEVNANSSSSSPNETPLPDKPSKYPLIFPTVEMHMESKMAALKVRKTLRQYILDAINEENKKHI